MTALEEYVEHFRARVLREAWLDAWSEFWIRRAEAFEAAIERPGDFLGQATEAERDDRSRRLLATAVACRNRATLADDLADQLLAETAGAWSKGAA